MSERVVRVGIVGANPRRGWASLVHVPALRLLPRFRIEAVATRREASAREAAERFGAVTAYTKPHDLAGDPNVDLVVVAVRVPHHAEVVEIALAAGKPVYCEWPLGKTTAEAERLAAVASAVGVPTAVGLQGRFAAEVRYARDLIADGYIGHVASVAVYATTGRGADGTIPADSAYTMDSANGADLITVMGGHTLDVVQRVAGEITEVAATLAQRRREFTVAETGERVTASAPDHLSLTATMAGGALATVHLHGGRVSQPRTRIDIAGTDGDLSIETVDTVSPHGSLLQIGELRLMGAKGGRDMSELPVPDRYLGGISAMPSAVRNVAEVYTNFAGADHPDGRQAPDFADGVRIHRLLDAIRLSANTGTRRALAG